MRIHVESIPSDGLDVAAGLGDDWARTAARHGLDREPAVLSVELRVERAGEAILVTGRAEATLECDCDRCGEPVRVVVGGDVDLGYVPPSPEEEEEEPEAIEKDDLDTGWFDGTHLDLAAVVSEQFALWLPERIRCEDAGVEPVGGPRTCALPPEATAGPDLSRPSPFASLRRTD